MHTSAPHPSPASAPSMKELVSRLAALEAEREALSRQKRRNLLFVGAAVSLLVHMAILFYLASVRRAGAPGPEVVTVYTEFSVAAEEELTGLDTLELDVETPDAGLEVAEPPKADLDAEVAPPSADLEAGGGDDITTLGGGAAGPGSGGGGTGEGLTLGGGGGGGTTSFFGVSSTGTRFAYIVDVSGSMSDGNKLRVALTELARSVDALPDYAYFHIALFQSEYVLPPWQEDWNRAREREKSQLFQWLEEVTPGGGTQPLPAFTEVFALRTRPDVIFFMTDGQFPEETAGQVASMNARGQRVVINTIAFGDGGSIDQMRRIAEDSGGLYRFVPAGGGG